MKACVVVMCFAIAAVCAQPLLAAVFTQRGTPGPDSLNQLGTTDADSITQKAVGGDDLLSADGGDGPDRISQDGGDGADELYATGGPGNDIITQNGGQGNDYINVNGGYGIYTPPPRQENGFGDDDVITVKGGHGRDTITYVVGPGNDRVLIDGGNDFDTLIVNAGMPNGVGKDKGKTFLFIFLVLDKKGRAIFQNAPGEPDTIIRTKDIEHMEFNGYNGNGEVTKLFEAGEL